MKMSRLAQCIPVVSRDVFHAVRTDANALLGFSGPALPMLRPFVDCAPGVSEALCMTPMRHRDDWALALFLPTQKSFFVLNSGRLVYNFNHKVKACERDSSSAGACRVWQGTVLGVEHTDTNWFAADAFVIAGRPLLHLSFADRRKELLKLKDCMPELQFVDELDEPQGHRLWDLNCKLR